MRDLASESLVPFHKHNTCGDIILCDVNMNNRLQTLINTDQNKVSGMKVFQSKKETVGYSSQSKIPMITLLQ